MQHWLRTFLSVLITSLTLGAVPVIGQDATAPAHPPVAAVPADPQITAKIQRTMTLLATSTPQRRNRVRILFYGQSITEQNWSKRVADDLRKRFPHADLEIENRAIGGFASQLLVKMAETDLYSFYPDLMIFYVYGSHIEYENIIKRTRQRTTAEILMQTDHATRDEDLTEETDPAKLSPAQWTPWMNYSFLPSTAQKYGAGLIPQRNLWKQYLKQHQLPAKNLLTDGVHLNEHGNYVMAEIVKQYLMPRGGATLDPMNNDLVKTYQVGKDIQWKDGKLRLEFEGNRVDAIAANGSAIGAAPAAPVHIDGKKPSEFPELYGFTRTTYYPGSNWPYLLRVTSEKPLEVEEWTLTIKEASADMKSFKFDLVGSKTGPDGSGVSGQKFVSNSGRIVIDPADWNFDYALNVFKRPLPATFNIQWKVVPNFVDEFITPGPKDPGLESAATLAQGLKNEKHVLEITGAPRTPITAIRIYKPPLQ